MIFNETVISRRKELGLSQGDVAKALGYTPQAVSKFEKTGSSLPITVLPALSKLLKLPIDALFGYKSPKNEVTDYPAIDPLVISNNLHQLRETKKITLKEAAKELDISSRSLISYEDGSSMMGTATLELALNLYNVKPSEICYKKKNVISSTPLSLKQKPWGIIVGTTAVCVAIACAIAIPLSIQNLKSKTDSSESSFVSSGTSSFGGITSSSTTSSNSASSSLTSSSSSEESSSSSSEESSESSSSYASSSSSSSSSSSNSASITSSSSNSSISLGGELPSYVVIKRINEDGKPHKEGTYYFQTTYNDGYSLQNGIGFEWTTYRYNGEMDYEMSVTSRGQITITVNSITSNNSDIWIIVTLSNGKSTRKAETFFHLYNDHAEADYTNLPGLCDFYLGKDNKLVFEARRGDYIDLYPIFVNVAGESFTFSSTIYHLTFGNAFSYGLNTDYEATISNSPHLVFTIPNTAAIGSNLVFLLYIGPASGDLFSPVQGAHTVINIIG